MSFKQEDILKQFDLPNELIEKLEKDELTKEDFEKWKGDIWISRLSAKTDKDIIDPAIREAMGRKLGDIDTKAIAGFRELGINVTSEDLKKDGKTLGFSEWSKPFFEKLATDFKDLKESGNKDAEEKFLKLQTDFDILKTDYKTVQESAQTFKQEKEDLTSEYEGKILTSNLNAKKRSAISKVSYRDDISSLEKQGFDTILNQLNWALDGENLTVKDAEGQTIMNESKTKELSVDEIITNLAEENGVLKNNNVQPTKHEFKHEDSKPKREISPAAQKRMNART